MKERFSEVPYSGDLKPKEFVPNLSDEQLRSLAREKLSEALQAINPLEQPEMTRKLCAEVKDRLDGKPAQSMQIDGTMRSISVNATIRFADEPLVIDNEP